MNKAKASREVGLEPTAISSYLAKPDSLPRSDIALKLARALEVPLDWLVDDSQDWPPPSDTKPAASLLSDDELMGEVARRYRLQAMRGRSALDAMMKVNWVRLAKRFFDVPVGDDLPTDIKAAINIAWLTYSAFHVARHHYNPISYAEQHHSEMPGSHLPPETLDMEKLEFEIFAWQEKNQAFKLFQTYAHWLQQDPPTTPERKAKLEEHRRGMLNTINAMLGATAGRNEILDARNDPR